MAVYDATTPRNAPAATRFIGFVHASYASLSAWQDRRATRKILNKLSDRELADIGLDRGSIDSI